MLTLEQQVVSLELAKKMRDLGFPQQSLFWWQYIDVPLKDGTRWELKYKNQIREADLELSHPDDQFSAYTVGELGELLPTSKINWQNSKNEDGYWFITDYENTITATKAETEADARAQMLICLAKNRTLKRLEELRTMRGEE